MIGFNIVLGMILWNLLMSTWHYKRGYHNKFLYCGLIGFSGKTNFNQKYIGINIAWNSLERGEDATGIFSPQNGLKKSLTKGSHYVLYSKNELVPDNYLIAHVRAATVGLKTEVNNAHPFERGNYVLAHNGTLYNHDDLADKYKLLKSDYNVDSDIIAGCINEANDITTVIKEINGAAAFLIHDKRNPDILYAFTNGERPLWRGVDNKGNMYISSLGETLYFLSFTSVKEFKKDTLYTIKNGEILTTKKIKNTPYKKPVPVTTTSSYYNHDRRTRSTITPTDFFKDCLVRGAWTISYNYGEIYVELKKGTYYHCLGRSAESHKHAIIKYGDDNVVVPITYLNTEDIIFQGNFMKLNNDYTDPFNAATTAKKGEIFVASHIYDDGDVAPRFIEKGKGSLSFMKKYNFTKLTNEERDALFNPVTPTLFEALHNGFDKSREIACETNVGPKPLETALDVRNNTQIMVDEQELEEFFLTIDDAVEVLNSDLVRGSDRSNLKAQVTSLLDLIFNARNKFLEPNITI